MRGLGPDFFCGVQKGRAECVQPFQDLANWYAGNRMLPYVNAGLFEDVTDVWDDNGLRDGLGSDEGSMTIDGKIWGVPYT